MGGGSNFRARGGGGAPKMSTLRGGKKANGEINKFLGKWGEKVYHKKEWFIIFNKEWFINKEKELFKENEWFINNIFNKEKEWF